MVGATEGEYLPFTPSLTASWPFLPEYSGWSYLPSSIEKCRWPSPCFGFLPTSWGASLKPVSLTLAVTVLEVVAPDFGATKLTLAPGAPTVLVAGDFCLAGGAPCWLWPPPQPPSTSASTTGTSAKLLPLV